MIRLLAYDHGTVAINPARLTTGDVVTDATRKHERLADKYNGERVRMSGWSHRRMVQEQVSRLSSPAIAAWPHSIY